MKSTILVALAAAATAISAEINVQRMAGGLPPNAPAKRVTPAPRARRSSASQCNTGSVQCCESIQIAGSGGTVDNLLGLLGITVPIGTIVGAGCLLINVVGAAIGSNCHQQPLCCENNHFNGLIVVGCSPINVVA